MTFEQPRAAESLLRCPKCGSYHGDDWSQCLGHCPMSMSPHFDVFLADAMIPLEALKE